MTYINALFFLYVCIMFSDKGKCFKSKVKWQQSVPVSDYRS